MTSNGYLYPLQFTRDFITWPIGLTHSLGFDALSQEKAFYLYSFILFVALSYAFAALIVRYTLRVLNRSAPSWKKEIVRLVITVSLFTNLYVLYLNVDGGTVTTSFVLVFLGISLLLLIAEPEFCKALSATVALNSLGFLLDPSNAATVVVTLACAFLIRELRNRTGVRTFVLHLGQMVLGFAGPVLFLIYLFDPALGTGATALSYGVRQYNLPSIQHYAANTTLPNVLRFTGYTWTTLTFSPPTILSYSGSYQSLSGQQYPTTVLLLPGTLSELWLLCLFAPVVLALGSLLVRRVRGIALPFGLLLLVCVGLTQWPWIPGVAQVVSGMAALPIVGPLIGESVYFPYFFMLGEAIAVVVLVGSLLTSLVAEGGDIKRTQVEGSESRLPPTGSASSKLGPKWVSPSKRQQRSLTRWIAVVGVACLVIFPGWQAFNGSFLPSRSYPTYLGGNGVPNAAPYEPVQVPADVEAAYDFLYNQPGQFNIYWPTGGANQTNLQRSVYFFDAFDSPKPLATLPALVQLVSQGDTGAIVGYLEAQDVRFFVLQNTSPIALQDSDYGLSNFTALQSLFDGLPGLSPVLSYPDLIVYEVAGTWGTSYPVSSILSNPGTSGEYAAAYAVGEGLGSVPAIVPAESGDRTLSVNGLSGNVSILSPGFLENFSGAGTVARQSLAIPVGLFATTPAVTYTNFSVETNGQTLSFDQQSGTVLTFGNWSLIDWGPSNVSILLSNGSIKWSSLGQATLTLNAGPSLTSGPGGIEISTPSTGSCVTDLSLKYRTSTNFSGSISSFLVDEVTNQSAGVIPASTTLSPSLSWQPSEFETATSPWTRYFTTRFQTFLQAGSVQVTDVNYTWNLPSLNFRWNVSGDEQTLAGWSLLNWSSPGPLVYQYSGGNISWNSTGLATASLNFGPPLTEGPGGVSNPEPGSRQIVESMDFSYATSFNFRGTISVAGYFQVSNLDTVGAISTDGIDLSPSTTTQSVHYTVTLPPSTRSFTIRLQATGFAGTVEFSELNFSWAWLPLLSYAPFGAVLPVGYDQTVRFPATVSQLYVLLSGPVPEGANLVTGENESGPFAWYRFSGTGIALRADDEVSVVVASTGLLSKNVSGLVYTGPYAVDLILTSGGQGYRPYETLDGNALFLYLGNTNFEIQDSSVAYLIAYYVLTLAYLALFYPILSRFRHRPSAKRRLE